MKFPIGAMSVGDILDRGLKITLARLPTFYVINLIVMLPMLIVQLLVPAMASAGSGMGASFALLLVALFALILQPIGTAASLQVVHQEFVDRHVGVEEALSFALGRFISILGASIIVGLIVGCGLLLLIIPGLIFWAWYAFVSQVIVVEGRSAGDSLERSKSLTEGYRWRIVGVLLILIVVNFIFELVGGALQLVLPYKETVTRTVGSFQMQVQEFSSYPMYIVNTIFAFLVTVVAQSYFAVCWTLLYFDTRIRKEGFDLELAAQQQTQGQGPLPS